MLLSAQRIPSNDCRQLPRSPLFGNWLLPRFPVTENAVHRELRNRGLKARLSGSFTILWRGPAEQFQGCCPWTGGAKQGNQEVCERGKQIWVSGASLGC